MSFYAFHIHFICSLFVSGLINYGITQQSESSTEGLFPKEKCESLLVNCSCYDLGDIVGIECKNKNDFSKFSYFLSSGEIFELNTTYEITLSGSRHLPPKILEDLIVYRLILDDPAITFDKTTIEGVWRLRRIQLRQSGITEVPDLRAIYNSIRKINLDHSQLTSIEGEGLQNLPLVQKLTFVNNSIRSIDPDVFKGTENLVVLDLSYNLLTSIPPTLLDPMKNLTKFAVSHNNLLHVNNLFSVTHPQFIFLDFNNITNAQSVLKPQMERVETLVLASNPIENITIYTFNGKIPNVRFLYLDHCGIQEFNAEHYRGLTILATLDLSYNLIEVVSKQSIDFGSNVEIDLIGNKIWRFDAEIKYSVKRFYMNENKLQSLNTTLQRTQVVEVSVARNQIKYLTETDFIGVHGTANLELQGNKIRRIDRYTFKALKNDLHYLDLSSNFIPSLNGSVRYFSQLKLLNLTDNLIQNFESGEFTGLNELSELFLQHNQILALSGQLQQMPLLQYLVITHNNIENLKPDQIPKDLKFLYFADNPFKCDCSLLPFLLWLNTSSAPATDVELCLLPTATNRTIQSKPSCPEMCSCGCAQNENIHFISVDCSSKNLSVVPPFFTSNFVEIQDNSTITFNFRRSLVIDQNIYSSLHIEDRVLGVDLENNSLESLETAHMPPDLVHLFLSNNKLRRLPESMFYTLQNLMRVSLSGNPWDCDCKALEFKKWLLSKTDIIQDINNTRCGAGDRGESTLYGKEIRTLTDLDICPTDIGMIVSVSIGILVILSLCLTTAILYTKYSLNIKVFLYSRGITWVKEQDLDYDKKFDAFISFSNQDEVFVTKEIISVIENKDPNIRLCVHYRHFRPGEFIFDNIIYAVQNSKRTILILSRNFLQSEWCLMEFRAAHLQALEDKVHRIIVVKVGDLPKEIDPSIKVYLDSTTYLTWGEKHFWNKLMYVLPTSGPERNPFPQNACYHRNKAFA